MQTHVRVPRMAASPGTQKLAIFLAFFAAALSFAAVGLRYASDGRIDMTPLFGGILMLVLGISGYRRFKASHPSR
jgi:hypothetical protein